MRDRTTTSSLALLGLFLIVNSSGARCESPPGWRLPYIAPLALQLGQLTNPNCLWRVPTQEKVIALTFDDGPSVRHMPALLAVLRKHHLKATFFILGDRIDGTPTGWQRLAILQQALMDGHEIAFHGATHRSLFGVPDEKIQEDILELKMRLAEIPGLEVAAIRFFRPPFGRINARIAHVLSGEGLTAVNASLLPGDSLFPAGWEEAPDRAVRRILRELHPGAIVCLHIGENIGIADAVYDSPNAAEIVDKLAPELGRRGYHTHTLAKLISEQSSGHFGRSR